MARVKMVTRTISCTIVELMVCDTCIGEISVQTRILNEHIDNDDEILTACKPLFNPVDIPVKVINKTYEDRLYGMPESEFLKYADRLPDRVKKED